MKRDGKEEASVQGHSTRSFSAGPGAALSASRDSEQSQLPSKAGERSGWPGPRPNNLPAWPDSRFLVKVERQLAGSSGGQDSPDSESPILGGRGARALAGAHRPAAGRLGRSGRPLGSD